MLAVTAGCSKKSGASSGASRKASYEKAAATLGPVITSLKGADAAITKVPETVDLTTMPTLAGACVSVGPKVAKLEAFKGEADPLLDAIGAAGTSFGAVIESACKDVTYADAGDCWKPCSLAWVHVQAGLEAFHDAATAEGVTVPALE